MKKKDDQGEKKKERRKKRGERFLLLLVLEGAIRPFSFVRYVVASRCAPND